MKLKQRFRRNIPVGLVGLFVFFSLSACTIKSPNEPVWDVEWILPIMDKKWTMEELADEVDELSVDSENEQIILTFDEEMNVQLVDQILQVTIEELGPPARQYPMEVQTLDSLEVFASGVLVGQPSVIDNGVLRFIFSNSNPNETISINLVMLDIYEPDGVTRPEFDVDLLPPPEGSPVYTEARELDLQNYIFNPPVRNGRNYLRFMIHPRGSAPENFGGFGLARNARSFVMQSLTGLFNQVEVHFDSVEIDEPIPEEFKDILIQNVGLKIALEYNVSIPLDLYFSIEALEPRNNPAAPIIVDEIIAPAPVGTVKLDTISIPNVAEIINSNPETIVIGGMVKLGDGTSEYTVTNEDFIHTTIILSAPLTVELPVDTTTADVDTLEIDEDTRDVIRDNFKQLSVSADIENHTPVAADVYLLFSETYGDSTLYEYPADLVIGPVRLAQATLTGDPAVVTQSGSGTWNQTLTKDEMRLFSENEEVYVGTRIIFLGTSSQMAKIRPSDYIKVFASLSAILSTKIPDND